MNKALAMILAALAFAAFAVDTNRVTMTRLGSLNPRSGEVVTDVNFSGIAMTGDVARVEGKVDGMTNTFLRLDGGGAVYGSVSIYRQGRGGIPLSISTWDSDGDPYSLYFSIVNDKWQIIHEAIGVDVAEPYRITLPEASGTMALDSDVAKAARDSTNYTDSAVANYLLLSGGTMTGGLTVPNLTVGSRKAGSTVGVDSVAEGFNVTASEYESHAEGFLSVASGRASHAEGFNTVAQNHAEHAQGWFNASHKASDTFGNAGNTLSSIGFGAIVSPRNAVETMQDGKTFIYGLGGYDGTNPTGAGVQDLATAILTLSSALDGKLDKTGGTLTGGLSVHANDSYPLDLRCPGEGTASARLGFYYDVESDTWRIDIERASGESDYSIIIPRGRDGTLAFTSDIPASMAWGAITGKPTTISGYGITDALKSDFASLTNNAAFTSAVAAVSPPTDLTHVEAEIETNRTAIATLSARAYIEVVSADEVYYVFTTNQE